MYMLSAAIAVWLVSLKICKPVSMNSKTKRAKFLERMKLTIKKKLAEVVPAPQMLVFQEKNSALLSIRPLIVCSRNWIDVCLSILICLKCSKFYHTSLSCLQQKFVRAAVSWSMNIMSISMMNWAKSSFNLPFTSRYRQNLEMLILWNRWKCFIKFARMICACFRTWKMPVAFSSAWWSLIAVANDLFQSWNE